MLEILLLSDIIKTSSCVLLLLAVWEPSQSGRHAKFVLDRSDCRYACTEADAESISTGVLCQPVSRCDVGRWRSVSVLEGSGHTGATSGSFV